MPGPVKAPHFYRADETPDGAWLWMEHIESQRSSPWLARQHFRSWGSDTNLEQIWQFPLHQKHISEETRFRCEHLWTEREVFYSVMEDLPQCFSHLDSNRRNLFIRRGEDEQDEIVLVDWEMCGLGPLGAELFFLVSASSSLLEWPPSDLPVLDSAAFDSYLQGLKDAGWSGEADMVRLGYLAWLAMIQGASFLSYLPWWCSSENRQVALQGFGQAEEELYLQWLPVLYHSLAAPMRAGC